ncbi:MAG: winged helix-turn-helix transcriptional regulator [Thermoplasmata archaeon]|nr:MAG: winged helix-turn-helix transcriptional regulator [Thermoplasmata archaeon]
MILPSFHQTEASDVKDKENFGLFETQENDIVLPTPFVIPLYYKTPQNLFLNETRANIFDVVSINPGITFGAITRELGLAPGECQYHLRVLEREGHIKSKRAGKYTRYYLTGQRASEHSEIQEQILLTIKEKEGLSQSEIASELGISRQVANYNIKSLLQNGAIIEVRENSRCYYYMV